MNDDIWLRLFLAVQTYDIEGPFGFHLLLVLILILVNGFFAASEMAVVTLKANAVRLKAEEGNSKAKILIKFIENQGHFLATIQIGVTLAGFLSAAFGAENLAPRLSRLIDPDMQYPWLNTVATVIVTIIISFFSLVFGELVPKRIGMAYPERFSMAFAKVLNFFDIIFTPLTRILNSTVNSISSLLGLDKKSSESAVIEEEIRLLTEAGQAAGAILSEEAAMIRNVFAFDDKSVGEIMTPRTAVLALDVNSSWQEIYEQISTSRFSRIPVYEDEIDNIIGIVHVKDFVREWPLDFENFNLTKIIRPAHFVPKSKQVNVMLSEMRTKHISIAVVIDEYGGMDGIITLEDVIEELVGEIEDEYDEKYVPVEQISTNTFIVDALLSPEEAIQYIPELDQLTDLLEDDSYDTMAGFVLSYLKKIPEADEKPSVNIGPFQFTVSEMDDRRISKLLLTIFEEEEEDGFKGESEFSKHK